jgi:hypothetical protein
MTLPGNERDVNTGSPDELASPPYIQPQNMILTSHYVRAYPLQKKLFLSGYERTKNKIMKSSFRPVLVSCAVSNFPEPFENIRIYTMKRLLTLSTR